MTYLRLLLVLPLLMAFQCNDDDALMEDRLNDTGLLGTWEINDEINNNISDLLPRCCQFFEFLTDDNKEDLSGQFMFTDDLGQDYQGVFSLNESNQTIRFQRDGNEDLVYDYDINAVQDYLRFTFTEGSSQINQGWVKRN